MTNQDDITIQAQLHQLRTQLTDVSERQARSEATIEQLNKSIAAGTRMTILQFIGFVVVMAGTLLGTMYWATGLLEKRIEQTEKRMEVMEKNFNERMSQMERNVNDRMSQSDRNLNARFDDLKQVILSKR